MKLALKLCPFHTLNGNVLVGCLIETFENITKLPAAYLALKNVVVNNFWHFYFFNETKIFISNLGFLLDCYGFMFALFSFLFFSCY
jgi:hypothetical protein